MFVRTETVRSGFGLFSVLLVCACSQAIPNDRVGCYRSTNAPDIKLTADEITFEENPPIKSFFNFERGRYSETIEPKVKVQVAPSDKAVWRIEYSDTVQGILVYDYYDKHQIQMARPDGGVIIWKQFTCPL